MEAILEDIMQGVQSVNFSLDFTTGGLSLLVYILQALALYTIAKRRGINKPWLAWIPLVNVWILGSVSDQYQYVVKGQVKNKRKALLGLNIAIAAIAAIVVTAVMGLFLSLLFSAMDADIWTSFSEETMEILLSNLMYYLSSNFGLLILLSILAIPLSVLAIIQTVFFLMALYDVYRSCEPKNCTLYFVLSLFGNIVIDGAYAIFLMLCKDKDLGMPPRKPEPEVVSARPAVEGPWENTEE